VQETFNVRNFELNVVSFHSLLISCVNEYNAKYIVRGVRSLKDFLYESDVSQLNTDLDPGIKTVVFMCPQHLMNVSSSMIKIAAKHNRFDVVQRYVHPIVLSALKI
jgi:pantetheine-phosphate adenylyltransferase